VAEFEARRPLFTRPPRFVHADLWPENVLTRGGRCWLVDWTWLKPSDYALDLANLKLVLDWVWPPWRAQRAFEGLLRLYARALGDDSVPARMRVFSPLAALIKLVQFGEESPVEPYNADCMRAFLATARRDRALWALPTAGRRLQYAVTHRPPSAYSVYNEPADLRSRAGRALARLVEAGWRTARRRLAGRSLARPAPPATGSRPGHGARA
jgi:hypothetical protein